MLVRSQLGVSLCFVTTSLYTDFMNLQLDKNGREERIELFLSSSNSTRLFVSSHYILALLVHRMERVSRAFIEVASITRSRLTTFLPKATHQRPSFFNDRLCRRRPEESRSELAAKESRIQVENRKSKQIFCNASSSTTTQSNQQKSKDRQRVRVLFPRPEARLSALYCM